MTDQCCRAGIQKALRESPNLGIVLIDFPDDGLDDLGNQAEVFTRFESCDETWRAQFDNMTKKERKKYVASILKGIETRDQGLCANE